MNPLICYYDGKHVYTWLATNSINNVVNGIIKIFEAKSKYASGGWFADARGNKTWDDSILYSANYNSELNVISSSGYRVIQKDMDTFAKYLRTYYSITTK